MARRSAPARFGRRSGEPRLAPITPDVAHVPPPFPGRVTAGVTKVSTTGPSRTGSTSTRLTPEQVEASLMFEAIGEVNQAVRSRASLVSGCQFYIGLAPDAEHIDGRPARDETGAPLVDATMLEAAETMLGHMMDSSGSQAGLIRAQSENFDITASGWMVSWYERADGTMTTEADSLRDHLRFEFVGPRSYWKEGARQYIRMRKQGQAMLLPADAAAWSMWRRHPEFPDEPFSWLMGCLPIARNLLAFQLAERSQALSAAIGKIHIVPADAAPRKALVEGQEPIEAGATMTGDEWAEHLDTVIGDVIAEVMDDWQSGRSVQGGVLAVEQKFIEGFGTSIDLGRSLDPELRELTQAALTRLKESADIAPEMLTGLGDTNRWNGAQIDDTTYRRYDRPHLMAMANEWTTGIIWPHLQALGFRLAECRQLRVLVGTKGVVGDPDLSKEAEAALKAGAITWDGYRKMVKIPAEYAPSPEERAEMKDWFKSAAPAAPGQGTGSSDAPADVLPVNQGAGSGRLVAAASSASMAQHLHALERQTRTALAAAGTMAFDQALARAGSKMANLAKKHRLATIPAGVTGAAVLAHLGPELVRAIAGAEFGAEEDRRREELFAAAIVALRARYEDITRDAMMEALAVLGIEWPAGATSARSSWTGASISQADVTAAIEAGWAVLDQSLTGWADEVVFGSDGTDLEGDSVATVPTPIWRRTMAAVGGGAVVAGYGPIRENIGTMLFGETFGAVEPPIENQVWYYGSPGTRATPFEEHLLLDGLVVTGEDDDQLSGAPWGSYWPGDHLGCQCDVFPTFAPTTA